MWTYDLHGLDSKVSQTDQMLKKCKFVNWNVSL